jgi:hypothetical protein
VQGGIDSTAIEQELDALGLEEQAGLRKLLAEVGHEHLVIGDIWRLLDLVWETLGCDNRHPDPTRLSSFYRHPVWILNGIFIEHDGQSLEHRHAVVEWVKSKDARSVLDFGGGFGTLARAVSRACGPGVLVDIYEPFPSEAAIQRLQGCENVRFVEDVDDKYDCVVGLDVLEHLQDPLSALVRMTRSTCIGGHLLLGNCFEPVTRCHLPATFHLRHTLDWFTRRLGLRRVPECRGYYFDVFRKTRALADPPPSFRLLGRASRALAPILGSGAYRAAVTMRARLRRTPRPGDAASRDAGPHV